MAVIAQPYKTYTNIIRWIRWPALWSIILAALFAGLMASSTHLALDEQFDVIWITSLLVYGVAGIGVLAALFFLCGCATDESGQVSLEDVTGISVVTVCIMWFVVGAMLFFLPKQIQVDQPDVVHVMPDGTSYFAGATYERAIVAPDIRTIVPLTYLTAAVFENKETIGETNRNVTIRTLVTLSVTFAENDRLANRIRRYATQPNVSVEMTLEQQSGQLAQALIDRYRKDYPDTPLRVGMKLPYTLPWVESIVVQEIEDKIL